MIKNFHSYDLAVKFYKSCTTLRIPYHLKDQLLRASSSVVLNLGEGTHRLTAPDRRRFFNIAYASLKESECILELTTNTSSELITLANRLGGMIYNLVRHYTDRKA